MIQTVDANTLSNMGSSRNLCPLGAAHELQFTCTSEYIALLIAQHEPPIPTTHFGVSKLHQRQSLALRLSIDCHHVQSSAINRADNPQHPDLNYFDPC
jgi:hypothetical protein